MFDGCQYFKFVTVEKKVKKKTFEFQKGKKNPI